MDNKDNDDDTDRMNAVKKVKPLAPLRALTSNIVDPEYHVLDVELDLDNAGGADAGVEDVLGGGDVSVLTQASHVV